jgi:ABC-type branched-subunit amino acid transport system substrate-binding protein
VRQPIALVLVLAGAVAGCSNSPDPVVVGAVYPTEGGHGPGGLEEYRGVLLASELANRRGGVDGRPIRLRLAPAESAEAAPGAVRALGAEGVDLIVGSYGSTISRPAAAQAAEQEAFFWETGAVGEMDPGAAPGELVFRFAPTGRALGRAAVAFIRDEVAPRLPGSGGLRYSVAFVDDEYGQAVGAGALEEIRTSGLGLAGTFPYDPRTTDFDRLADRVGRAGTDVLVVVAYLEDGVAFRRAMVEAGIPLAASIGTSSSYCHPEFGQILGPDAVGLFASDKPDADFVDPARLTDQAGRALRWGRDEYERRYGVPMSSAALSGFAAGWALFHHVLPRAHGTSPEAVAEAARVTRLPMGSLPNASGLYLAPPDHGEAGANLRAATVIWEWVERGRREVVWPPGLASGRLVPIPLR